MSDPAQSDAADHGRFRRLVLALAGVQSLFWICVLIGGYTDMLPSVMGDGRLAAAFATFIFALFVLPALLLALLNRLLGVAFALAALGIISYVHQPLLRLFMLFG